MDKSPERDNIKVLQTSLATSTSKDLRAETTYELVSGADSDGNTVPTVLGRGRFAKVFQAWQRSAGHNVRPVAIKILHENMDKRSEALFLQEIGLLKETTAAKARNVIGILDILQLGPMAMCGSCGQIYHPRCPMCGEFLLERYDPPGEAFPALRCRNHGRCKYLVSGDTILNNAYALLQHPAKTCCTKEKGARAQRGTLINFVDRDAVVMELLDEGLPQFKQSRRRTYARLIRAHGVDIPGLIDEADEEPAEPGVAMQPLRHAQPAEVAFVQRVMLLEKMLLMVQLAESVAWLHGVKQIVHKDLAPDNIMLKKLADDDDDWRGLSAGGLTESLTSHATCPSVSVRVIDLGLADQVNLSRNWYEEPVQSFATEKLSYLSLEARQRKRRIYQRIEFDVMARQFVVPDTLRPDKAGEMALKIGDLLVDESDPRNMYCMEVTAIHKDAVDKRIFRASYTGEPPPNPHSRQFDLVLRLGEAHDLYAMGAVCYFILTGEHTDVRKLTNIADLLQDAPQPLRADVLTRTIPSYTLCRDLLPERFYQDELMVLILRAMVRGQPESLVSSRIERGAEPSRRFLHEIRTLYNRLTADVLAEPILRSYAGLEAAHAQQRDSHSRELAGLRQAQSSLLERQQQASALWEKRQQRTRAIALAIALIGFGSGLAVGAQRARLLGAATVDSLSSSALAEDAKPVERK